MLEVCNISILCYTTHNEINVRYSDVRYVRYSDVRYVHYSYDLYSKHAYYKRWDT